MDAPHLLEQTWRWFGPADPVPLAHLRQAGATGVVTALHDVPAGEAWTEAAIEERLGLIRADPSLGLSWSVVESLPVAEAIKLREGPQEGLLDAYRASLRALGRLGVRTICYNFMPVLDWTRTDLAAPVPGGGRCLRFNAHEFAAFDALVLERPGAEDDHPPEVMARARAWFAAASESDKRALLATISAGLPGAFDRYDLPGLRRMLARYAGVAADDLRANLAAFLRAVVPAAEEAGVRLCVHPDDPPRPLLGLPRVVSTGADLAFVVAAAPSPANGLTFCTGSLGAGAEDVAALCARFAPSIAFAHLRNVSKDPDSSFEEAEHLGGDVDMVAVVGTLLDEQARRRAMGDPRPRIPFRPDHGHQLLDDLAKPTHPGYPAVGRLRGLAEIRGVMTALARVKGYDRRAA